MITSAVESTDQNTNEPNVSISLNDQGSTTLGTQTQNMPNNPAPTNQLAIFLDNTMVNNANVQQALTAGTFQIHAGNFSTLANYRKELVPTLHAAPLPRTIPILLSYSVGAPSG